MARSKPNNLRAPLQPMSPAVDKNVSGRVHSPLAAFWKCGRNETNMRSTKRLFATERSNESTQSPQETPASAEDSADSGDETSRWEAEVFWENVRISPAFRTAKPAVEEQGQGTKKMRKMRKVGGDDGTGNACRVNPAAKDAFHETSSPKKQSRGTQTPTTIADEFAVESRPTVQTYTKISFDIYGCSHCGQKIIARDRSTHRWHCGKAKAATRCDLCGHVSYRGRKGSIELHQKSAICRAKRMDYARSLAQLRSAVPRRMRVQAAIERERQRKIASAADKSCAAAAHDDEGFSEFSDEDRGLGAYNEDLKGDDGEGGAGQEGDNGEVSASSDAAEEIQGPQEEGED